MGQKFLRTNEEMQRCLREQDSSAKLLNFLKADLLCVSQIETSEFRKNISRFCVEEAIREITTIFHPINERHKTKVSTVFVGFERQTDSKNDLKVTTDKQRLQQVFLNLFANAVKLTPQGGQISIRCVLDKFPGENGSIKISITDNAIEIAADPLKQIKIFGNPDFTLDAFFNGAGSRLLFSSLIAEQFGGKVGIVSKIGQGITSHFHFELASSQSEAAVRRHLNPNRRRSKIGNPNASFAKRSSQSEETQNFDVSDDSHGVQLHKIISNVRSRFLIPDNRQPVRILIIDDDLCSLTSLRTLIREALIELGHDENSATKMIETASDGTEAVEKAKQVEFAVVLMDCTTDSDEKFKVCRQIKCLRRSQPKMVACSENEDDEFFANAWAGDLDEVVIKPVSAFVLGQILKEISDANE